MKKEELYDWINKNYRRNTQPLYAWVDAVELLEFIKSLEEKTGDNVPEPTNQGI